MKVFFFFTDNSKKIPEGNSSCVVCQNSGPPPNDGAHKCSMCEVPVHAIDGCSVGTSSEVEGYGGSGRLCMKCAESMFYHINLILFCV